MQFFLFFMKAENRGGKSGKKLERKRRGERRGGISTNWIYQKKGYFQSSNSSMPTKSPGFWLFPLHLASPKMCHCTCCTSFTLFPHPEAMGAVFFPPKSALLCTHCTLWGLLKPRRNTHISINVRRILLCAWMDYITNLLLQSKRKGESGTTPPGHTEAPTSGERQRFINKAIKDVHLWWS